MTTPGDNTDGERVDLGKHDDPSTPADEAPFDPYRFGRPEHPIAPEYAPPGYVPDPPQAPPPSAPPGSYPPPPSYGQPGQWGQQPPGPQSSYQQTPYQPPQPYQQYPQQYPPHYQPYGPPNTGKATTAMVLGIVSIVFCWLTYFDLVLIAPAVVFGIIGLTESRRNGGAGRGKAITGLVCAAVAVVLGAVILVVAFGAIDKCGGVSNSSDSGFKQCVQDHL